MKGEVSPDLRFVFPSGNVEFASVCELYGLELAVLPPALVLALAQPLLLQPEPLAPDVRGLLPSRIPSWWQRPARRRRFGLTRRLDSATAGD